MLLFARGYTLAAQRLMARNMLNTQNKKILAGARVSVDMYTLLMVYSDDQEGFLLHFYRKSCLTFQM